MKTYSSGMYVRLAFSVAINVDPRLLIIDEILAVGDVTFQQKCLEKFVEFRNEGRTIVLVTHDLGSVRNMCDRAIWLQQGQIIGEGDPKRSSSRRTPRACSGSSSARRPGSTRRGSGEMIVTGVEMFVGDDPNAVSSFPDRRHRALPTVVHRLKAVPRPIFTLMIDTLGGATVTSPCTRDVGLIPDSYRAMAGSTSSCATSACLPGAYDVHTSCTTSTASTSTTTCSSPAGST